MRPRYAAILAALLLICGGWILNTTSSFSTYRVSQSAIESERAKENSTQSALSVAKNAALYVRCTGHVVYDYRDAATAVATIFIALFTLTLWRATVKLGESGQKSFEATDRA